MKGVLQRAKSGDRIVMVVGSLVATAITVLTGFAVLVASRADEDSAALERSLFGVVAIDTRDGGAVGMLRVCGDPRQYSIWDVMVLPGHQGRKIGTAMLESAVAELRRRGPAGTMVSLFTGNPRFYERVGFKESPAMCLTL
jgi:putative acetyltransferase